LRGAGGICFVLAIGVCVGGVGVGGWAQSGGAWTIRVPSKVTLEGRIVIEPEYEKPSLNQAPKESYRPHVPYLKLEHAINTVSSEGMPGLTGEDLLMVLFAKNPETLPGKEAEPYEGKCVSATGKIDQPRNAAFSKLVFVISRIKEVPCR
jgi:hypothetical protein